MAEYALKAKDIQGRIKVKTAKGQRDESSMKFWAVPLALNRFKVKQTPAGLKPTVYKKGGSTILPKTFQATVGGTKKNFVRTEALTPTVSKFVTHPSKKLPFRSPKGSALPINRLWADPDSEIVAKNIGRVTSKASEKMSETLIQGFDRAWQDGKF